MRSLISRVQMQRKTRIKSGQALRSWQRKAVEPCC